MSVCEVIVHAYLTSSDYLTNVHVDSKFAFMFSSVDQVCYSISRLRTYVLVFSHCMFLTSYQTCSDVQAITGRTVAKK